MKGDFVKLTVPVDREMLMEIHGNLCDLLGCWQWKVGETRRGHDKDYKRLEQMVRLIGEMLGYGQGRHSTKGK